MGIDDSDRVGVLSDTTMPVEIPPLFKADSATLSFYAAKDGKISVSYQGWDQSKTVLAGQTVCAELGAARR